MNPLSSNQVAQRLGLEITEDYETFLQDEFGLANLIRMSLVRRGIVTRRELLADWRPHFTMFGFDVDAIRSSLVDLANLLSDMGEFTRVRVGNEHGWAKTPRRWLQHCDAYAIAFGAIDQPLQKALRNSVPETSRRDPLIRFDPSSEIGTEFVEDAEAISFDTWLGPPGWYEHWERRGGTMESLPSLQEFWEFLRQKLRESESTAGDGSSLRILGKTGNFFGRIDASQSHGRWVDGVDGLRDGDYLGAMQAYNENDWRFLLIEITNSEPRKTLLLENWDEFCWCLLARGVACGQEEQYSLEGDEVSFSFPIPKQVSRVIRLWGWPILPWRWKFVGDVNLELFEYWKT
ncbi:hypothetical protein [Thalassoglobus sp.]|uniref:hypothetical protein n=1 Tax=Thalassoglobus sp. TaxID=2795869 RepID=UPI003AA8E4CA